MDKNIEILLNSKKNIHSVDVDSYDRLELATKFSEINEYNIRNVLSATEVFEAEREANPVYRIYGKIEYMSLLNGLKNNYTTTQDFFLPQITNSKNLTNSFDFYLVKAANSGYTNITTSNTQYIKYFQVIATPNEFELYPVGFANNVYGEQAYAFNFTIDFNVSNYVDNFGFPLTELFLYAQYKPATSPIEQIYRSRWSTIGAFSMELFTPTTLHIGDFVKTSTGVKIGDLIEYSKPEFLQTQLTPQEFWIHTPCSYDPEGIGGAYNVQLTWKYNPFIPITLRYFGNDLYNSNISGTSYEETSSIPYYATEYPIGTGNYVWRNIMPQGYIDPITNTGIDCPFVNKKRYLFTSIMLDVIPVLQGDTQTVFQDIWFTDTGDATNVSITPTDDIDNIGKPCQ
jgi:hypothetical protein